MQIDVLSSDAMQQLGAKIGALVRGGETIELVGDIGAGKTTFTKGLASGMGIDEDIQSPTFTISRVYEAPNGLVLAHYDFYRLNDPGIMRAELDESVHDAGTVTVIEWAEVVADVLPADTLRIVIRPTAEESRAVTVVGSGAKSSEIAREIT
jgi:tRNA threonylcarbamoyladenosine biosynthesis protein TsaE